MSAPWLIAAPRSLVRSGVQPTSAPRAARAFVCRQCRKRHPGRSYSTAHNVLSGVVGSGVAALASRRLISVAGPDSTKFLHGVITSNMMPGPGKEPQSSFYTGFLNAQGRVLHDVIIYRDTVSPRKNEEGAYFIEVDAGQASTLAKHIRRYKLRAKFDVKLLDAEEVTVWHAWGDKGGVAGGNGSSDYIQHFDTRAPGLGWRYVAVGSAPPAPIAQETGIVDESAYRVHRYLLGVAEGQHEIIPGSALPLESNMEFMGGIDFRKGCYVGQELTIRTKHRGVVRKRILPCIVYGEGDVMPTQLAYQPEGGLADLVPADASIARVGKKGRSAGKWLSGIGNVGLALCRLEAMTDLVLPGETAASSFDPANEFLLKPDSKRSAEATEATEGAKDTPDLPPLKIKAFVPDWLRQGLAPAPSE